MRRDLGLVAAVTVAAVAASAASAPVIVTSALAIPALLVAPGYAWTSALFAQRTRTVTAAERAVLTLGVSLAILVLGGLLIAAVRLPLQRTSWLALAALAVASGLLVGWRERRRVPDADPAPTAQVQRRPTLRRPSRPAMLLAGAALITGGAVATAIIGAKTAPQTRFTSLAFTGGSAGHVLLSLRNVEGSTKSYLVVVTTPNGVTQRTHVTLPSSGSWEREVTSSAGTEADLYLLDASGHTGAVYRRVTLQSPFALR